MGLKCRRAEKERSERAHQITVNPSAAKHWRKRSKKGIRWTAIPHNIHLTR
jgi:hypothetical protein